MTNKPTPRDLDPNFEDAHVPDDAPVEEEKETREEVAARLRSTEVPKDPHEGYIVARRQYVDSAGNVGEQVHGPMPRSEWAAYSHKKGL